MKKRIIYSLILLILIFAILACSLGATSASEMDPISETISTPVQVVAPTSTLEERIEPEIPLAPERCYETEPHPIGQNIAETYEVEYKQVMEWFCEGNEFEDILVALETKELTGMPVETLLEKTQAGMSWDQIWQEIGLTD
jgi:hypothetical protein